MTRALALLLVLGACAAPAGSKAVNPACVWHCVVEVTEVAGTPKLATLTLGADTASQTRSTTTTGP